MLLVDAAHSDCAVVDLVDEHLSTIPTSGFLAAVTGVVFQTQSWTAALDSVALKCIFIKFFLSAKE